MYPEIVGGVLRHILTAVGPLLVALGVVDDAQYWEAVAGAIITIVGFGWSIAVKMRRHAR